MQIFNQKIEDMINEVKFSEYVDTNKLVETINLDDFIKRTFLQLIIIEYYHNYFFNIKKIIYIILKCT